MSTVNEREAAINRWHEAVNAGDLELAAVSVGDPIVVLGPKGSGRITPGQFADWVERSGIRLRARSWHPVGECFMVVEQEASWPQDPGPVPVATAFRVSGGAVAAALRYPDLRQALDAARLCEDMR